MRKALLCHRRAVALPSRQHKQHFGLKQPLLTKVKGMPFHPPASGLMRFDAHRLAEGGARRPSTGSLCSVGPAPGRRGTSRGAQSADCRSALYGRLRTERAVVRGPPHPLRIPLVGVRRAAA